MPDTHLQEVYGFRTKEFVALLLIFLPPPPFFFVYNIMWAAVPQIDAMHYLQIYYILTSHGNEINHRGSLGCEAAYFDI